MTACFVGHRQIEDTKKVASLLKETILQLIENGVSTFLFGSMSQFDQLAWEVVSEFREEFSFVKRVYVRSAFQEIDQSYTEYLLHHYEETYFPPKIQNAGKYSYVERNFCMIDSSTFCVFYYNPQYTPPQKQTRKTNLPIKTKQSGTKIAFEYAIKKGKTIFNLFEQAI